MKDDNFEVRKVLSGSIHSINSNSDIYFRVYDFHGKERNNVQANIFLYNFDYDTEEAIKFIPQVITSIIKRLNLNGYKTSVRITKVSFEQLVDNPTSADIGIYKVLKFSWDNDDKEVGAFLIESGVET